MDEPSRCIGCYGLLLATRLKGVARHGARETANVVLEGVVVLLKLLMIRLDALDFLNKSIEAGLEFVGVALETFVSENFFQHTLGIGHVAYLSMAKRVAPINCAFSALLRLGLMARASLGG